jgi:hypothetical protein
MSGYANIVIVKVVLDKENGGVGLDKASDR